MFRIFSDSFLTATRHKSWDAPDHWQNENPRPRTDRAARDAHRREQRRWLRDTGIM